MPPTPSRLASVTEPLNEAPISVVGTMGPVCRVKRRVNCWEVAKVLVIAALPFTLLRHESPKVVASAAGDSSRLQVSRPS